MTTDLLNNLRNSSPNEGSHDLYCRCLDAAKEIAALREKWIERLRDAIAVTEKGETK